MKKNPRKSELDEHAVRELDLFAEIESKLYPQKLAIAKNLLLKMRKGKYDHAKAPAMWLHWYTSAAKEYARQYAQPSEWSEIFSMATRKHAAQNRADEMLREMKNGDYDWVLTTKKEAAKQEAAARDWGKNPKRAAPKNVAHIEKRYDTYNGWKRAVKVIDPAASFYGNRDIAGAISKNLSVAEWDGSIGVIVKKNPKRAASNIHAYIVKSRNGAINEVINARDSTDAARQAFEKYGKRYTFTVTTKKNPKRAAPKTRAVKILSSNPNPLYVAFTTDKGKHYYYNGKKFDSVKSHAVKLKKPDALKVAQAYANKNLKHQFGISLVK